MRNYAFDRLVEGVTYKPGWRFDVAHELAYEACVIRAIAAQPDAWSPGQEGPVVFAKRIPEHYLTDTKLCLEMLRGAVIDAEMHEVDEWLRVDGVWLRDPHPELKGQARHDQVAARLPRERDRMSPPCVTVVAVGEQVAPDEKGTQT